MSGMKEVIVIPVIVGALGAISTGFEKYIAAIGIEIRVEHAQKTTKNSFIEDSKDFETGTRMQKKKHNFKYHCARVCETFDNRLLSTLTESAGATKNSMFIPLSIIINNNNNNNNNNIKVSIICVN